MEKSRTTILSVSELNEQVEGYKGILAPEIVDYLDSLIGLEISALNQGAISEDVVKKLNELKLYRQIVIYNIYNRSLGVFKKYGNGLNLESRSQGLSVFGKDRLENKYDVFDYWINENGVSHISLEQTIIDSVKRKEQIDILYQNLEEVKASNEIPESFRRRVLCASKEKKITFISDLIKELENRSPLDGNIEYVTDAQEYFVDKILGDQGLQVTQDFVETSAFSASDIAMQSIVLNTYPKKVDRALTKKFVKTYPHTEISKIIKYY